MSPVLLSAKPSLKACILCDTPLRFLNVHPFTKFIARVEALPSQTTKEMPRWSLGLQDGFLGINTWEDNRRKQDRAHESPKMPSTMSTDPQWYQACAPLPHPGAHCTRKGMTLQVVALCGSADSEGANSWTLPADPASHSQAASPPQWQCLTTRPGEATSMHSYVRVLGILVQKRW